MQFLKNFLKNLLSLVVILVALYFIAPDMIKQVYQLLGGVFGPAVIILLLVVTALPKRSRRR